MRWYAIILIGIAFTSVSLAGAATGPADLTFKVDSTADLVDVKLADGKCQASNGKCTLRAALNEVSSMPSKGQPVLIVLAKEDYNLELEPPAAATRRAGRRATGRHRRSPTRGTGPARSR